MPIFGEIQAEYSYRKVTDKTLQNVSVIYNI